MGAARPRRLVMMINIMGLMLHICVWVMGMVAPNNVGGYKSMEDSGDDLNAEKASNVTAHVDEACGLLVPPVRSEVSQSRRKHAKQGREYLWYIHS